MIQVFFTWLDKAIAPKTASLEKRLKTFAPHKKHSGKQFDPKESQHKAISPLDT